MTVFHLTVPGGIPIGIARTPAVAAAHIDRYGKTVIVRCSADHFGWSCEYDPRSGGVRAAQYGTPMPVSDSAPMAPWIETIRIHLTHLNSNFPKEHTDGPQPQHHQDATADAHP